MFNSKKKNLSSFIGKTTRTTSANRFLQEGLKVSSETRSQNYAKKYTQLDEDILTQFGKLGEYIHPRSYDEISADMASIMDSNSPEMVIAFVLYIRTITRKTDVFKVGIKTDKVQKGSGLKNEGRLRMLWLSINYPDLFWKNIHLFISVGSWSDIFEMLRYDLMYNDWNMRQLDWNKFATLIMAGLENQSTRCLVKKFMPQIKVRSHCKTVRSQASTMIAKWLANKMKLNYHQYRELKSSGSAHTWQQHISRQMYHLIDFNTIPGKALLLMVSSKFLANHKLQGRYNEWIQSKPVAKFTGYVHDLFSKIHENNNISSNLEHTINKQYQGLLDQAKNGVKTNENLIVVRDVSGSMGWYKVVKNMRPHDIARALAIFFSEFLNGEFKNTWIRFASTCDLQKVKGRTACEKWKNDHSVASASTNFLGVVDLFAKLKRNGVPERDFPTGILCLSDGEFNKDRELDDTNLNAFKRKLRQAGFSSRYLNNFKFIFWNIFQNSHGHSSKFETYSSEENNAFYFSGYDPSVLAFLLGREDKPYSKTPKNQKELFYAAMDQEVLNMIRV